MDYNVLLEKAKEASEFAYAKYSKFKVGACVLAGSGKCYTGCNVENASYGLTICAERNAIANAVANGEKELAVVAIYSPNTMNCMPCGACRQVISEFQKSKKIKIITQRDDSFNVYELDKLFPESFEL